MNPQFTPFVNAFEQDLQNKLMLMHYRFLNLCVKAEPASLLSTEVPGLSGEKRHIEDAADVVVHEWNKLLILPKQGEDVSDIADSIAEQHPEFIPEYFLIKKDEYSDDTVPVLMLTMPPVNKDRHDFLTKAVQTLVDAYKTYIDAQVAITIAKIGTRIFDASPDDMQEVKDKLSAKVDDYKKNADDAQKDKVKEIDDAYQEYLKTQESSQQQADEHSVAANPEAVTSMKME